MLNDNLMSANLNLMSNHAMTRERERFHCTEVR